MARFEVFRARGVDGYLLDCQADVLDFLTTRLTVPLLDADSTPRSLPRLNPVFDVDGKPFVMATQLATAVSLRDLKDRVTSLAAHESQIVGALDMLITGV